VLPAEVCDTWRDWRLWTDAQQDQVRTLILDEFDALQNFFFWTWKSVGSLGPARRLLLVVLTSFLNLLRPQDWREQRPRLRLCRRVALPGKPPRGIDVSVIQPRADLYAPL
jgi:hypothetical protein